MASRLFAYRPGLDGIRGYGMIVFMLWHVGALTVLPGLWVFMNVFFILSAFLITRLLLAERRTYGDISVREFYLRRVRRLGPALLVMLTAVTVDGVFFAPAEERTYLKGDILSTLAYVMNWRLVARDDQYFEAFTHPSITRHAWSLSVEEQFYLVVPWLLIAVLLVARTRLTRTLPFVLIAVASAAWSATLPTGGLASQAHLYYGTDVRLQALALGVAAGVWSAHRGAGGALLKAQDRRDPLDQGRPVIEVVGWVGFLATLLAFATIQPLSPWMFTRGGMFLTSIAAVCWVIGCAQRRATPLVRLFSAAPAVHTGKISYGLYLYHWPIFLWLTRGFPTANRWVMALMTLALSYAAAEVSYRYLERPVMKHGLEAFGGRRAGVVVGTLTAALCIGAGTITGPVTAAATGATTYPQYVAHIPKLLAGQASYVAPRPALRVGVFGDSVPFFLAQRMPTKNFPGLQVTNLGTPGCDLLDSPVQWTPTQQQPIDAPCAAAKRGFVSAVRAAKDDAVVIMPTLFLALRHDVNGRVLWIDDASYRKLVETKLDTIVAQAKSGGASRVAVTTIPCRRIGELQVPEQYRDEFDKSPKLVAEAENPVQVNALIRSWASHTHVPVIDLASAICQNGYQPTRQGIVLYDDGIHFSPAATPMVWGWLAPQIVTAVGAR